MSTPTKPAKPTIQNVGVAVVERYLHLGVASSLADIAKHLGASLGAVRKLVTENSAFVPGCDTFLEQRPSYSKNYPGMVSGSHGVWVYQPKLRTMRDIMVRMTQDLAVYDDPNIGGDSKGLIAAQVAAEVELAHAQKR